MIQNFMLMGGIGPVDFTVSVAGAHPSNRYFYEEEGQSVRFFSRGNELILSPESVYYRGTGGNFCEYMFGVEKPLKDLVKKEILNRLVMFGAFLDRNEQLIFTNDTSGVESFSRLFLHGHAVKNYYFLVSSDDRNEPRKRQRTIVRALGKALKRSSLISEDDDVQLLSMIMKELNEPTSTVFVFKLVHRRNLEFYKAFESAYSEERSLKSEDEKRLAEISASYKIDTYQQERMKIDSMYKHHENKSIVDEYRDILLDIADKETIRHSDLARLHRLKMLSIRNNIPSVLFDTLDELLMKGKDIETLEEPEYLTESRAILENLFFKSPTLKRHIIKEDITKLIKAKQRAFGEGDMGFERILLDVGKACDDYARENNDFTVFEEFSAIITYFDRFDTVRSALSRIAFMEYHDLSEDTLRSLIGNRKEFDDLDRGLFREVFVDELVTNKYITSFGKKKIKVLYEGVEKVLIGDASLKDVMVRLQRVSKEERLYKQIRTVLKERMRELYTPGDISEELSRIRNEIKNKLVRKGISAKISEKLFDQVFVDLKKESYYVNQLLPVIEKTGDLKLREDFLMNSGLDRFYIEGIEKEYLGEKGFRMLVEDSEYSSVGGGERI